MEDTTPTTDVETTPIEDPQPEVGAAVVVAATVIAVAAVGTGIYFIWKAIDRRLAAKYARASSSRTPRKTRRRRRPPSKSLGPLTRVPAFSR